MGKVICMDTRPHLVEKSKSRIRLCHAVIYFFRYSIHAKTYTNLYFLKYIVAKHGVSPKVRFIKEQPAFSPQMILSEHWIGLLFLILR